MITQLKTIARIAVAVLSLGIVSVQAEILITTAGAFTGRNIFRGEQIQHGTEMAVADINSKGGVLGQRVEPLIADDACHHTARLLSD